MLLVPQVPDTAPWWLYIATTWVCKALDLGLMFFLEWCAWDVPVINKPRSELLKLRQKHFGHYRLHEYLINHHKHHKQLTSLTVTLQLALFLELQKQFYKFFKLSKYFWKCAFNKQSASLHSALVWFSDICDKLSTDRNPLTNSVQFRIHPYNGAGIQICTNAIPQRQTQWSEHACTT